MKEDSKKYLINDSQEISEEFLAVSKFLSVSLLQYAALHSQQKKHNESKLFVIECINLLVDTFTSFSRFTNEYLFN